MLEQMSQHAISHQREDHEERGGGEVGEKYTHFRIILKRVKD